ncbi:dsDNA binding protein [Kosakonia phage Kc304]|uniref:DsDNA binding protein, late transcription n=2 Tax=Winklervirus chi14 TaxID=2560752 RepID=A0A1Z1LYN5_9CAUD|nr:transcriptional regulator [Serratia phage CHI14]ARW57946.1 dsDNA binding protein, late transcription [Serratia phage CBH8]QYN80691.1 dsDNA binding protein [Kosakonia phage Kc304]UJJ22243.1 double-stranded DNA binding protein [Erwinia phage Virsaitis27]UYM28899.1 double stranded DNA binding protein [Serratia phage vB_SspM_LC53]ARW57671.1 dsDNA binding protein, late transcription [Serratia phage CHI14]
MKEVKEKKEKKVEFDEAVHGADLAKMVKEASDIRLKMEAYGDQIKEIKTRAKKELGVDGKLFNQVFALHHKGTRDRFESEKEEVVELYDSIFPAK